MVIWDGLQEERQFPELVDGVPGLEHTRCPATPGYSNFLNTPLTSSAFAADPTLCSSC